MAVAFDAIGTEVNGASVTTKDLTTLTIGAGATALVVQIAFDNTIPASLALNWDALGTPQPLTPIPGASTSSASSSVQLWGLINPTPGNKTLRASWTTNRNVGMQAVSWSGAASFVNGVNTSGSGSSGSVSVISAAGDAVMAATSIGSPSVSSVNNTQTFIDNSIGGGAAAGNRASGAASVSMAFTYSASRAWRAVGVSIKASAGSPAASAGIGTANGVGQSLANGTAASSGLGTASAINGSVARGVGASSGLGTASAVGRIMSGSLAASNGIATVHGVGSELARGVGVATATSTGSAVSGISGGFGAAVGGGVATVNGVGLSFAIIGAVGSSGGVATVKGFSVPVIHPGTIWTPAPPCAATSSVPFTADMTTKHADSTVLRADQTRLAGSGSSWLPDPPPLPAWIVDVPPVPAWTRAPTCAIGN